MVELDPQRPVVTLHYRRLPLSLLPERRLVQRHGVPADRRVEKQAGHLPVFRQINQPFFQTGTDRIGGDLLVLQPHSPAAYRTQAVKRFGKLGTPGPHQPGQTDDLPGVNLKAEIDKPFPGEILHPQHREILRLGSAVARQRQPQLLRIA